MNAACNKDRRATTAHKVSHNHVCYQGSHAAPPIIHLGFTIMSIHIVWVCTTNMEHSTMRLVQR